MPLHPPQVVRPRLPQHDRNTLHLEALAIVGGLNPTATAPFPSRFAPIAEPSAAETHSVNDRRSADTCGPQARANTGRMISSRVATPTATPL